MVCIIAVNRSVVGSGPILWPGKSCLVFDDRKEKREGKRRREREKEVREENRRKQTDRENNKTKEKEREEIRTKENKR